MSGMTALLAALVFTEAAVIAFVLVYATRPWWTTRPGKWLMATKLCVAVLLASSLASAAWDYPGALWVRAVLVSAYGIMNLGLLGALLATNHDRN